MRRTTTRKEIIEEFDENGNLKSRTTIEEREEEDENCKTTSCSEKYWDATQTTSGYVQTPYDAIASYDSTELVGQIGMEDYVTG